ncbi:MAG: hypothetical protein ACPLRM_08265, partial [Anaerolineae bacterium]
MAYRRWLSFLGSADLWDGLGSYLALPKSEYNAFHFDGERIGTFPAKRMLMGTGAVLYGAVPDPKKKIECTPFELASRMEYTDFDEGYHAAIWGHHESFRISGRAFAIAFGTPLANTWGEKADVRLVRLFARVLVPDGVAVCVFRGDALSAEALETATKHYSKITLMGLDNVSGAGGVAFFGVKKAAPRKDEEATTSLLVVNACPDPFARAAHPVYRVPAVSGDVPVFTGEYLSRAMAEKMARNSAVYDLLKRQCERLRRRENDVGSPPCDLHKGHIAMMLIGGRFN